MYKITNIACNEGTGFFSHHPVQGSPECTTLDIEPWISGMQLKLYESRMLTEEQYKNGKAHIDDLVRNRIIAVENIAAKGPLGKVNLPKVNINKVLVAEPISQKSLDSLNESPKLTEILEEDSFKEPEVKEIPEEIRKISMNNKTEALESLVENKKEIKEEVKEVVKKTTTRKTSSRSNRKYRCLDM